jgi:hypothetical protein
LASAEAFLARLDRLGRTQSHTQAEDDDCAIADMILRLCTERGPGKTICPSQVARALASEEHAWRTLMPDIRRVADDLSAQGRIVVTQRGAIVDPMVARGAIRLGLAP